MSQINPYAPPEVTDLSAPNLPRHSFRGWLYLSFLLQSVTIVIAWGALFFDVETILMTGVPFISLGSITAILAYRQSDHSLAGFGISSPLFAIFIFLLIVTLHWSPADATMPVRLLGSLYGSVLLVWAISIYIHRVQKGNYSITG